MRSAVSANANPMAAWLAGVPLTPKTMSPDGAVAPRVAGNGQAGAAHLGADGTRQEFGTSAAAAVVDDQQCRLAGCADEDGCRFSGEDLGDDRHCRCGGP